jgi:hypothetical protein
MPIRNLRHRANRSLSAARIGKVWMNARGSESQKVSEPPGALAAEIQPGDRLPQCVRHGIDWPTSLAGKPRARRGARIGGYLSGFSGDRHERDAGATRNRSTEILTERRALSPMREHRAVHSFSSNCRRSAAVRVRAVQVRPPRRPSCPTQCPALVDHNAGPASRPDRSHGIPFLYTHDKVPVKNLFDFPRRFLSDGQAEP